MNVPQAVWRTKQHVTQQLVKETIPHDADIVSILASFLIPIEADIVSIHIHCEYISVFLGSY